ncbi:MAG: hypothetical protein DWQ19_12325 [Crenarchaeota archaeon]|nr:MAG: hypothetical protein DWQ19_12325 [Thermoproteota archaeon]
MRNARLLLEHTNFSHGEFYEDTLILGGCGGIINEMELHESSNSGRSLMSFRGKFQEADAVNKNKRLYPRAILENNTKRLINTIKDGGLIGELDHPTDSIIHFKEASHKITKLWWDGNILMGEGIILNTPCGKILQGLINSDVRIGISSRGVGNGKVNEDGILVIGESYKLITFDAVADPSTHAAFQEKVVKREWEIKDKTDETEVSTVKNETRSIDMVNKDLLLACLGGVIKKQAKKLSEVK